MRRIKKIELRVCHYPQVNCMAFVTKVENLKEAKLLSDVLAAYDLFQLEQKIKPKYSNVTVVEMWDEENQDWIPWYDVETGIDDIDEYLEHLNKNS